MKTMKQNPTIFGLSRPRPPLADSLSRIQAIEEPDKDDALVAFEARYAERKSERAALQTDYRKRCAQFHAASISTTSSGPDPDEARSIRRLETEIKALDVVIDQMRKELPEVAASWRLEYNDLVITEVEPWRAAMHETLLPELEAGIDAMAALCRKLIPLQIGSPWLVRQSHLLLPLLKQLRAILATDAELGVDPIANFESTVVVGPAKTEKK